MMRERAIYPGEGWERHGSGLYLPPRPQPAYRPTCIDLFAALNGSGRGKRGKQDQAEEEEPEEAPAPQAALALE